MNDFVTNSVHQHMVQAGGAKIGRNQSRLTLCCLGMDVSELASESGLHALW